MIVTESGLCEVRNERVRLTLNKPARGAAPAIALACSHMRTCPRTAFCRLVNPLTVRVPVRFGALGPAAAALPEQAS